MFVSQRLLAAALNESKYGIIYKRVSCSLIVFKVKLGTMFGTNIKS